MISFIIYLELLCIEVKYHYIVLRYVQDVMCHQSPPISRRPATARLVHWTSTCCTSTSTAVGAHAHRHGMAWHGMHPQWKHITNRSQHTFSVAVPCTTRSVSPHLTPQIFPTATSTIYPIAYLTATPSQHVCICSCASHVTSSTTHHSTSQHEWRNASQYKVPLLGYMGNVLQVHLTLCPFTGDVSCG